MPLLFEDQLKIVAGSPGADKVLTSDNDGLSTWRTLESLQSEVRTGNSGSISGALTQNNFTIVPTLTGTIAGFTHVAGAGYNTGNGRVDPTTEGFYRVTVSVNVTMGASAGRLILVLFGEGGTEIRRIQEIPGSANATLMLHGSAIVYLNGSTNWVQPRMYTTSNTATFSNVAISTIYVELLDPTVAGGGSSGSAGGVLAGSYPNPSFSTATERRIGANHLGERIYFPEDFGALADGSTNDTAAIQDCINAAAFLGGGVIQFSAATYRVSSALGTDHNGNSILKIPDASNLFPYRIRFRGVSGKTTIECVGTGYSYSATFGPPSVIGGPTAEGKGNAALSGCEPIFEDLNIKVPANPTISGLDLGRCQRAMVKNVSVTSATATTEPTNVHTFGIRMPQGQNYGDAILDNTHTHGLYAGIVINTAHTTILSHVSKWCKLGVGITGSGEENNIDPHGSVAANLKTEACYFHMGGWAPTVGLRNMTQEAFVSIALWDIEDATAGNWYSTFAHIADTGGKLRGTIRFLRVLQNSGIVYGITGSANNIEFYDLARGRRESSGSVTLTFGVGNGGVTNTATVSHLLTTTPAVVTGIRLASNLAPCIAMVSSVDADSFDITAMTRDGVALPSGTTVVVDWIARLA